MTTPPEEHPTRSSGGVRYPATVCLSFDFDAFSSWLRTDGSNTPGNLSRGEFGNVGARRLLALLAEYNIASTWFVPGHTLETFPETAAAIVEAGHEIGHHNYAHENPRSLAEADERKAIERGIAAIKLVTGTRPAGYRSPSWDVSASTLKLLVEYEFAYDSSLMSQDFTLYRPRGGDVINADGPARFGHALCRLSKCQLIGRSTTTPTSACAGRRTSSGCARHRRSARSGRKSSTGCAGTSTAASSRSLCIRR